MESSGTTIKKMVELIDNDELTETQYKHLLKSIKNSNYYDPYYDFDTEELIDQLGDRHLNNYDKELLRGMIGDIDYDYLKEFYDKFEHLSSLLPSGTLDCEMRVELLLKLLKQTTSLMELEELIGSKALDRVKYVII